MPLLRAALVSAALWGAAGCTSPDPKEIVQCRVPQGFQLPQREYPNEEIAEFERRFFEKFPLQKDQQCHGIRWRIPAPFRGYLQFGETGTGRPVIVIPPPGRFSWQSRIVRKSLHELEVQLAGGPLSALEQQWQKDHLDPRRRFREIPQTVAGMRAIESQVVGAASHEVGIFDPPGSRRFFATAAVLGGDFENMQPDQIFVVIADLDGRAFVRYKVLYRDVPSLVQINEDVTSTLISMWAD